MACSSAQLESNRKNAQMSTGPRSDEGKARSRENAYKHGLTGEGVVLPHEDAEAFDNLVETLEAEMRPKNTLARECLTHLALLMLKLTRGALHETKCIAHNQRKAEAEFDAARLSESDHLISWIANEPATNARRLRRSPEGLDLLIGAIKGLLDDLSYPYGMRWGWSHCDRLHHLLGLRREDVPVSRFRALTEAIQGKFQHLDPHDGEGQMDGNRALWALQMLAQLIEVEIAKLKTLRENFDHKGLDLDRAEAKYRAMFDASKEAVLARKYHAANERTYSRTLKEFRMLNADATKDDSPNQVVSEPAEELGSFSQEPPEDEIAEADADPTATMGTETALEEAPTDRKRRRDPAKLLRGRLKQEKRESSKAETDGR